MQSTIDELTEALEKIQFCANSSSLRGLQFDVKVITLSALAKVKTK